MRLACGLDQAVPRIPLDPVVQQRFDDLPLALAAVLGGLNLAPGGGVRAEVALDVVKKRIGISTTPK